MNAIRAESLTRLISGTLLELDWVPEVVTLPVVVVVVCVIPRLARQISLLMLMESPQFRTQMSFYRVSRT